MKTTPIVALSMLLGIATAVQSHANTQAYVWTPFNSAGSSAPAFSSGLEGTIVLDSSSNSAGSLTDIVSAVFTIPQVGTIDLTGTTTPDPKTGGYYLTVTKFTPLGGYSGSGPGTPMGDYFNVGTDFSWNSTEITAMTIGWISDPSSYQIQTVASLPNSVGSFFASVSDSSISGGSISDLDPDGLWLAETPSSSVPDVASTCLLLGLGLAGLAVASRKKVAAL